MIQQQIKIKTSTFHDGKFTFVTLELEGENLKFLKQGVSFHWLCGSAMTAHRTEVCSFRPPNFPGKSWNALDAMTCGDGSLFTAPPWSEFLGINNLPALNSTKRTRIKNWKNSRDPRPALPSSHCLHPHPIKVQRQQWTKIGEKGGLHGLGILLAFLCNHCRACLTWLPARIFENSSLGPPLLKHFPANAHSAVMRPRRVLKSS